MNCELCGKPDAAVKNCAYYRGQDKAVCVDCCDKCHRSEPFPCREHDARTAEVNQ
jgi:hypothetical protein